MKPTRIAVAALVALVVIVATACGSSDKEVPSDAVAVVDGVPVTKTDLDGLIARAKATYKTQKRAFPKAGTPDYQSLQTQAVAFLVQRAEYDNRAEELKLTVTDEEIDARIDQVKKQSFAGSQAKLDKQLKEQGYTKASLRADMLIGADGVRSTVRRQLLPDVELPPRHAAQPARAARGAEAHRALLEGPDARHAGHEGQGLTRAAAPRASLPRC